MQKQIPLFAAEKQQRPQPAPALRGIIQRRLDELQATRQADWIKRTTNLKFQRMDAHSKGPTP